MRGTAARRAGLSWGAGLSLGMALILGGCGHLGADSDSGVNAYPANYKTDILGAMHAYLNNPTGIREAAISEPAIKTVAGMTRYMACLKFNAKKNVADYAGTKVIVAVFLAGRFDQFIENTKEDLCTGVTYAPYPELQKLPP
jgi:hypothetical protein